MKRFALMVLVVLALAAPAFGQGVGDLSIYADDQGNICDITANGGGTFMQPFVIQKFGTSEGSTGCRFKITVPVGMSIVGFNTTFVPVGNVGSDLSLAYGVCLTTTTVLGNLQALSISASPACSYISVLAADNFTTPIATDCSFGEYIMGAGQAIVNNDGSCPCNIATSPSTWGKVKSLYR